MTFQDIDSDGLAEALVQQPLTCVLFGLDDCRACAQVDQALSTFDFARFKIQAVRVIFRELNPQDVAAMNRWRVAVVPHVRLYTGGRLLGAWESVTRGSSEEDIKRFTERWIARTLSDFLSAPPTTGAVA